MRQEIGLDKLLCQEVFLYAAGICQEPSLHTAMFSKLSEIMVCQEMLTHTCQEVDHDMMGVGKQLMTSQE